ncbi:MAG: site-specific integrase [Thiotrichaceae bacterium]
MSKISKIPSNRLERFNYLYDKHVKHLHLQGLRDKTIDAYSRAIRRTGEAFNHEIEALTEDQLLDHFSALLQTHSISTVKLDMYGLKFFYLHVLKRSWKNIPLVKSPRVKRLPDVLTVDEVRLLLARTRVLSYRIFFYTTYSMGLRLGEALALEVGDIDANKMRVHIRNGKGGKDRFVPLTQDTLSVLRHFWQVHRHPTLLFPNRKKTLSAVARAKTPLDRGGIQKAMREVVADCGFKKRYHYTACATAMPHTC